VSSDNNAEINLLKARLEVHKKDKTVYFLLGLLIGLVVSFIVTNRINANAALAAQAAGGGVTALPGANGPMPDDGVHAGVKGGGGSGGGMQPAVREALQKAKDNPKDFEAQIRAAGMYYQIGQNDQAREYLQRAYDIKPDGMEYEALIALGQLDIQGGKNKEAQPIFEKAIKLKPDGPEGYTGLGNAYRGLKDFDKAIAQLNKALSLQPKDEDALHELAHAYIDKGDARNAELTINRLNDVNSKNENIASLRQELDQLKLTGKIPSH